MKLFNLKGLITLLTLFCTCTFAYAQKNILVFSKTEGYRHQSIDAGKSALAKMAKEKGFIADFTEDAANFNELNLKKYNAVVFLNTTGDVLNDNQQSSFERYIQAGGGYVGVHAATDTEYKWPWYNQLAGAWFLDHPMPNNVQNGKFYVTEQNEFTAGMPSEFERKDEFYSFKNISPKINVVLKIDEKSYEGGTNGDNHPISWYHEFQGGRAFYTAMGHTDETYTESLFLNHLYAGINYVSGGNTPNIVDFSKARPEENRFTKVVLKDKLDEPMELTLLDKDRVLFIQRKGEVRLYNDATKELKTIAKIPVSTKLVNAEGKESMGEDGLLGLNKDPNFSQNNWIYLFYSSTKGSYNQLSRFTMKGDQLLLDSEIPMLQVPVQREECCHTGGSIAWDKAGNLFLSTGDNTNPHGSDGYSPSDERPGRSPWDAQKSSANTNDLRGKIIRITPQPDGSYTIPEGNLFAKGTEKTRPEIYSMGHRNPFRISVDPKTNYVYWGEVGPDASKPDSLRGPAGHDEVGQARKAGNFGWPHFVGNNKAYFKYDFEAEKSGKLWDVNAPTNTSPNNTGLEVLPPAQNAFYWYPYGESPEFPLTGTGGRNAMAGPVYYANELKNPERAFPDYYEGKFFSYEWMRGWVMVNTLDSEGNLIGMEKFMPSYRFSNPMDMVFADNGDLYMLEYGSGWFTANDDARLIRIEYNGGNRKPQLQMAANQMGGAIPFNLQLNSKGTFDADNDKLNYNWTVTSPKGKTSKFSVPNPSITLEKEGIYKVSLTVNDGNGGISTQSMEISAGNEPPVLSLEIPNGNTSFYVPNKNIDYAINVTDKEDGILGSGIKPENVAVSIDYLAEGFDKNIISMGHRSADESAGSSIGKKLIEASDCMACHSKEKKSIGPSYRDVANKYKGQGTAVETLTKKIISGGSGVWGETPMAGHPALATKDATEMVNYILSIANEKPSLPTSGTHLAIAPEKDNNMGVYILRAAYQDQGANGLPSLRSEQTYVLRNTKVDAHGFDEYKDINKMAIGGNNLAIPSKNDAYIALKQIDLNGIKALNVFAAAPKPQLNAVGGKAEVHLGNPKGPKIGESEFLEASETIDFTPSVLTIPFDLSNINSNELEDLYLVFVNPKSESQSLMVVMGVEFKLLNDTENTAISTSTTSKEFFLGNWTTTAYKTPEGDIVMDINLQRTNDQLTGTVTVDGVEEPAIIDKIEEKDDSIKLFFKMAGFNIKMNLKKENQNTLRGKTMGIFKTEAIRVK